MSRREGVGADEIKAFMCGLIKAFRRFHAHWKHHCDAFTGDKEPAHVERPRLLKIVPVAD